MEKNILLKKIQELEEKIQSDKKELSALRKQLPKEALKNYIFKDKMGKNVSLKDLFNGYSELIVIHNMGKGCAYCTLWADGFNGFTPYFESRAGFVVSSPDNHQTMSDFAKDRGWKFNLVSTKENTFKQDLGFLVDKNYWPGISILEKTPDGKILHTSKAIFGPGDNYCSLWDIFDLLNENKNWRPKYQI